MFACHDFGLLILFSEAEKLVGWAKNHYLSSCLLPSIKGERLCIPRERYTCKSYHSIVYIYSGRIITHLFVLSLVWSLEIAISRMKGMETMSRKSSQNLKACGLFYCCLKIISDHKLSLFLSYVVFDHTKYGYRTLRRMNLRAISFQPL